MESEGFHESFEGKLEGVKVYMTNAARYDTTRDIGGEYYRIIGVPTFIARFRRLGPSASPNYELIRLTTEEDANVMIQLGDEILFGRFHPIASTSKSTIIQHAVREWQNDLLVGIDLNLDTKQS